MHGFVVHSRVVWHGPMQQVNCKIGQTCAWSLDAASFQTNSQASLFEAVWLKYAVLQKGYYHRNANFQSYVDHKHQEFVSGARACVDPPHLRMVFDEAVVKSLAPQAAAEEPAEPSHACPRASRDGLSIRIDTTSSPYHGDCQPGAAANLKADADAHVEAAPGGSGCVSPSEVHTANNRWQAVMQRSMQLARDTKWTHKGLQASAVS